MKVDLQINDREVRDALARLVRQGTDLSPAMRLIAASIEAATQLRFKDGRDPGGAPWKPLAPSTRRVRAMRSRSRGGAAVAAAVSGPMQPLLDTGQLRRSITSTYGAKEAVVGTNLRYAPIHQFGGQAGRRRRTRIAARPYLGLSVADRDDILDILREHLAGASR